MAAVLVALVLLAVVVLCQLAYCVVIWRDLRAFERNWRQYEKALKRESRGRSFL